MSWLRSCGVIRLKAFLYRFTVSRDTLSSSAVWVWFIRVIASMYCAAVDAVSEYFSKSLFVSVRPTTY